MGEKIGDESSEVQLGICFSPLVAIKKVSIEGALQLNLVFLLPVAPEILRGCAYGPEVDMWSVGIITYIL